MAPKKSKARKAKRYHIADPLTADEMKNVGLTEDDVASINASELRTHSLVRSKRFTCPDCGEAAPECGKCGTCGRYNCCE